MTPKPKIRIVTLTRLRLLVAALENHACGLEIELDVMRCNELAVQLRRTIRRGESAREILERWEEEEAAL